MHTPPSLDPAAPPRFAPLSSARLHQLPGIEACGATDIGPVRKGNEDNFLIDEAMGLAMVADGMGGHAAGEVASAGVLTAVRDFLAERVADASIHGQSAPALFGASMDPDATCPDPAASAVRLAQQAVEHANTILFGQNRASERGEGGGMGTTLTGFWRAAASGPLVFFHVGDSRLYRLRDGVLEQLTRDQTMYQQALEAGLFDHLPPRNLLLQAVGPMAAIVPEVRSQAVLPGDILMLCSDGLHGSVPHAEIDSLMAAALAGAALDALCLQLIELAKQYGGRDNITVLIARCS